MDPPSKKNYMDRFKKKMEEKNKLKYNIKNKRKNIKNKRKGCHRELKRSACEINFGEVVF